MKSDILEKIDSLFGNMENLSMDKVEGLVHETLKFFEYLRNALTSNDEKERTEAMEVAKELQKKLEEQAEKAYKAAGLSPEEIQRMMKNPSNFLPEDWNVFEKVQKEISDYQKEAIPPVEEKGEKKRKAPQTKIPG